MLKQLFIQNIVLVESTEIHFKQGLNILSGETGTGKSAILEALELILGERADTSMIRRGAEKGVVQARFEIDCPTELQALLSEAGIDHSDDEDLILRREIYASGKSRAYINHQMAQLHLLRSIGIHLMRMCGQHANQKLLSGEHQRTLLDLYGDLTEDVKFFSSNWKKEQALRQQIDSLIQNERTRLQEMEALSRQIEELEEAALKEGEDEELFGTYTLLVNVEEIAQKVQSIYQGLHEEEGILSNLFKHSRTFEELMKLDPKLTENAQSFQQAVLELEDIAYSLQNYVQQIDQDPQKILQINERLSLIMKLKRKYGNSVAEIMQYKISAQSKLAILENTDDRLESLKGELEILSQINHTLCSNITQKREVASKAMEMVLTKQLRSLNMPKVEFQIKMSPQRRGDSGEDKIDFYLVPNVGEHPIPVKDCASGGELSRLMLALQTLLAGKEKVPTLIFDEIDANIGGETATIVGKKLREIGAKHQVLCITHFAQVAKHADYHFQISKEELEGRTHSLITLLDASARQKELLRMQGNT